MLSQAFVLSMVLYSRVLNTLETFPEPPKSTFSIYGESCFMGDLLECDNSMECIVMRWLIQQVLTHHV